MNLKIMIPVWALTVATAAAPRLVTAQTLDQLGNRANALGAFVALADDASAVAWNPAGLINGPIFNILLDFGRSSASADGPATPGGRAGRFGHSFLALGVPPLGLSYSRERQTHLAAEAVPSGSAAGPDTRRENRQVLVRSLVTSNLGVTLLQSLADGVTVGTTVKLVRGAVAAGTMSVDSWDAAFDQAEASDGAGRITANIDVGVLVSRGRMRGGLVARNMTAPTFEAITLKRHVRAGAAWGDSWPGTAKFIVALDADLTRVPHATGDRRDIAAGAERWLGAQKFGVRGGLRASTVDGARPIASVGGSLALRPGMYVDVTAARGRDAARWSVSARVMY